MLRIVLDTNVLVSGLLQESGPSARIFRRALSGWPQMCITGPIYAEYEEVVRRPRLRIDPNVILEALHAIRLKSLWVRPVENLKACVDTDDDKFVECAATANADYLITGNVRHFPSSWERTLVVTPRQFFDIVIRD